MTDEQEQKRIRVVMRTGGTDGVATYKRGEVYYLPEELAKSWLDMGYCETLEDAQERRREEEEKKAQRIAEFNALHELLAKLDITMDISTCGCCGGAALRVHYQGVKIIDQDEADFSNEEG